MATQKKTHTTKKSPVKKTAAKKTAAQKGKAVAKARPLTWRFYAVAIGIFVIAVSTMIVIALFTSSVAARYAAQERLERINTIYSTLNLDNSYTSTYTNIFGDKRPYDTDKSRTQSSQVDYVHADTVSNTVAELDTKIKAAGFTFVGEPYPGSNFTQYHYKSAEGEYIRLNVQSKPYYDAYQNAMLMNEGKEVPQAVYDMDKNAGPSEVTIKVNLDDNNE